MKFTEKLLLDNYVEMSNCGEFISCGKDSKGNIFKAFWTYGCEYDLSYHQTDNRDDAEKIIIQDGEFGKYYSCSVPKRCMNREKYNQLMSDYESWCKEVMEG